MPTLPGVRRREERADAVRYLTLANQLTILRIMLIPAFVLQVVYGYLGAALATFVIAGLTDALDGLIARRAGQRTSLGAWLDPMADKLLLVTTSRWPTTCRCG
jgi:cardiolipin synthase (CMP-forming)